MTCDALANSPYNAAHDKVQLHFLDTAGDILATETPVWVTNHECDIIGAINSRSNRDCDTAFESIAGHIDLIQIKDNLVWVLDYKPHLRGCKTERPECQLYLYTWLLSIRSGLPFEMFRYGWFNDRHFKFCVPEHIDPKAMHNISITKSIQSVPAKPQRTEPKNKIPSKPMKGLLEFLPRDMPSAPSRISEKNMVHAELLGSARAVVIHPIGNPTDMFFQAEFPRMIEANKEKIQNIIAHVNEYYTARDAARDIIEKYSKVSSKDKDRITTAMAEKIRGNALSVLDTPPILVQTSKEPGTMPSIELSNDEANFDKTECEFLASLTGILVKNDQKIRGIISHVNPYYTAKDAARDIVDKFISARVIDKGEVIGWIARQIKEQALFKL
jgi:hypothetical protein